MDALTRRRPGPTWQEWSSDPLGDGPSEAVIGIDVSGMAPRRMVSSYLLVDDFPPVRQFLRTLLAGENAVSYEAGNGPEALEIFSARRPDWVVMDIEIPQLNGLEATRAVRRIDAAAGVVLVSQHEDWASTDPALAAGAWAFLRKDDLLRLPRVLGRDRS